MSDEARCLCGTWVWGEPGVADVPYWGTAGGPVRQRRGYCFECDMLLTVRDGQPVAEAMVARRALAWLVVRNYEECYMIDCPRGYDGPRAQCLRSSRHIDCIIDTAIAAAAEETAP